MSLFKPVGIGIWVLQNFYGENKILVKEQILRRILNVSCPMMPCGVGTLRAVDSHYLGQIWDSHANEQCISMATPNRVFYFCFVLVRVAVGWEQMVLKVVVTTGCL